MTGSLIVKVCVVYHFSRAQGMEHVDAILIDELIKQGAEVVVATVGKIDLIKLFNEKFDIKLSKPIKTYSLLPESVTGLPIFQPFVNWFSMLHCLYHENPDVIYIDGYCYRIPEKLKRKSKVFVYINELRTPKDKDKKLQKKLTPEPKYIEIYTKLFNILLDLVSNQECKDRIICNSHYTANLYEKIYSKAPEVVFPPVSTSKFSMANKENLVTCLGVFHPRKRFETTIRAIALSKTKPKLAIIGGLPPGSELYLYYLKRLTKQLKMEEIVSFYPNSNFKDLNKIVTRSKICVSNGIEYFGIALVEQMAAGCVPIVNKWTAPWDDIIEQGKFGFGFETCEDLADIIDRIITDKELQIKMSNVSRIRAKDFDESVFREKMANLFLGKKIIKPRSDESSSQSKIRT